MNWKEIQPSDPDQLKHVRIQFHQIIQAIAAVGRHFLPFSDQDDNATLMWDNTSDSLVGHWVATENGDVRAGINLSEATIFLETGQLVDYLPVQGKTFGQLMVWVEEQVGKSGLPVANYSANLPYELPEYAKLPKGFDLGPPEVVSAFISYYSNSFDVLQELQADFEVQNRLVVYPHHFDQALSVKLKDSGEPETSSYVTLGMSPGDEQFEAPYFYVNSWPHVEESVLKPLTAGNWHVADWVGGLITATEFWEVRDQRDYLVTFFKEASSQLQAFLLD